MPEHTVFAEVAINAPVQSTFTYHVPPSLDGKVRPGHLVRVSFGTSMQPGIVLALQPVSAIEETKPIDARLDPEPVVSETQIAVARWMSETYLAPIGLCLWLFLLPGMTGHNDLLVRLEDTTYTPVDPLQQEIIALLKQRGARRLGQIQTLTKHADTEKTVKALVKAGVLSGESVLAPPRVRPRTIQTASLNVALEDLPEVMRHIGTPSRRADTLQMVANLTTPAQPRVTLSDLRAATDLKADAFRHAVRKLAQEEQLIDTDNQDAWLKIPHEAVDEELIRLRKAETLAHILRLLARESDPVDVSWIYAQTGANLSHLKRLEEPGYIAFGEKEILRDVLASREFVPTTPPRLTPEQEMVWRKVQGALRDPAASTTFLLHGVTGSGKTEIYLRAIAEALAQGKQALFLVPEIALTAQTLRRVAARFPKQVAIMHGSLSDRERHDTWRRIREGLVKVVVGARSALFAPLPQLGIIIIDEEHEQSFRNGTVPYYDTRLVAMHMAALKHAVVILGSATPDIQSFFRSERGEYVYLNLPQRIVGHRQHIAQQAAREGISTRYAGDDGEDALTIDLPLVDVVDMREELQTGNTSMFSALLQDALDDVLARRQQAILFLNRRGTSTFVFCRDCGYVAHCPRCDMPLTYHAFDAALHCHHCGLHSPTPTICPQCKSRRIKFFGAGTQQVEAEVARVFPLARVVRWDADTARNPAMHDHILERFATHDADVMVGTQMIAKGLDLPLVTLVGVISADTGLALPDYRAGERTFQLLTQVSGRAGRGLLGGRVILQTYQPGNYAIDAASRHDYYGFYAREIAFRRDLGYPPFRRLARVLIQSENALKAREDAERAAAILRQHIDAAKRSGLELIGPAPCFFSRLNRQYRWHVILRGIDPASVLAHLDTPRGWSIEVDPLDLL